MPTLGIGELLLIFGILLLVFGANRLPQLGESLGKAVKGLKRGLNSDDQITVEPTQQPKGLQETSGDGSLRNHEPSGKHRVKAEPTDTHSSARQSAGQAPRAQTPSAEERSHAEDAEVLEVRKPK